MLHHALNPCSTNMVSVSVTFWGVFNLIPRAHMSFGQRQDTELWNNHQTSGFTAHGHVLKLKKGVQRWMWIRSTKALNMYSHRLYLWTSCFKPRHACAVKPKFWTLEIDHSRAVSWHWPKDMWALGTRLRHLGHCIMQFKEFDWLSGHGIWAIIPFPTNMVGVRVNFWGRFYFHFSLVFHDFEGF